MLDFIRSILSVEKTRVGNQVNDLLPSAEFGKRGKEQKIVDTFGPDQSSELMTLCIYQFVNPGDGNQPFVGPVIARVEIGTGGGATQFEFDVPQVARIANAERDTTKFVPGSAVFSLPAARVGVYARNDSRAGLNILEALPDGVVGGVAASAHVGAFLAYSIKPTRLFRTLVWSNTGLAELPVTGTRTIPVPAATSRVNFPRQPMTNGLSIQTRGPSGITGAYIIAPGSIGDLEFSPQTAEIAITNTGPDPMNLGLARFLLDV